MIKITGHRGAAGLVPENTVKGFVKAVQLGCDRVEMDVRFTSDRKLVLMHDESLDRTTNGKGLLRSYTLNEVSQFLVAESERIPRLEEVLEVLKSSNVEIQIELKDPGTEKEVPAIVKSMHLIDRVIFTSFYHRRVKFVLEQYPLVSGGLLIYSNPVDPISILNSAHATSLHIHFKLIDEQIVKIIHNSGKQIVTWGSVENPDVFKKLIDLKVDVIGSNRPDLLIGFLKKRID